METVSLLFDSECRFLGELYTRDGALARVVLTEEGERRVGESVASWQTEGAPLQRRLESVEYHDRVSVRERSFLDAVRQWAAAMRLPFITVSDQDFVCWQVIAQLPLEPLQRYAMLNALRSCDAARSAEWREALTRAAVAVQSERERTRERIADMWGDLARTLVARAS